MAALLASAVASAQSLKDPDLSAEQTTPAKTFEIAVPQRTADSSEFQKFPEVDEQVKDEDDDEPIEPAYYSEGTAIPVFTPTMEQFRSFPKFVDKINHYGMMSGIVKIIPPKEWSDSLPSLDDKVRDIKIKNPIEQHIVGGSGEYRQTNIEKQRTYNLPEWRHLCEGSDHQPPARRGERRTVQTQPAPTRRTTKLRRSAAKEADIKFDEEPEDAQQLSKTNPPTPESPADKLEDASPEPSFGRQPRATAHAEETPAPESETAGSRQLRKARRKTAKERAEDRELADEAAYDGFDYRISDAEKYTDERCAELEKSYWRTLTYNSPLYGADMPGSLFDDSTTSWNVSKLENLLDCLGKKLPGVNTAYLYLGMWKSTFSWHLEDMDLYSINYIHFGAPKQWYSISKSDKPKFEQVMKSIWPNEAKKCSQFLRHKTFLVSPALLQQHGIKVNKLVHRQGEFVITFPFGYHSGYNLGYNCAESVNFATKSWLKFGREAKKCECIDDAVFVDIDEIERKLYGLPTDDEYEEGDEEREEGGYYNQDGGPVGAPGDFPTPPESIEGKPKRGRPRKRKAEDGVDGLVLKKVKNKLPKTEPCVLCPNDIPSEPLLDTENGGQAHRLCAIYTPETYFKWDHTADKEIVGGIEDIPKARLDLRCVFCRHTKGSCFQCSAKKCTRAFHATCAAAAGVLVNMVDVMVVNEEGEKYAQTNIDYRCKVHRQKRPKDYGIEELENDPLIRNFCTALIKNDVIQMQYFGGEIFAGVVIENRKNEEMVLVQILPRGDVVEVGWKWVLAQDPSNLDFPDAITTAPVYPDPKYPPGRKTKVAQKDNQESDEVFGEGYKWGELVIFGEYTNPEPVRIHKWWYYIGEQSTEYVPKYTEDPARRIHDPASSFIAPKPPKNKVSKAQAIHHQHHGMPPMGFHGNGHPAYTLNPPPGPRPQLYPPEGFATFPHPQQMPPPSMSPMTPRAAQAMHPSASYFNPPYTPAAAPQYAPPPSVSLQHLPGGTPAATQFPAGLPPNYSLYTQPVIMSHQQYRDGFMTQPQHTHSPQYHSHQMPYSNLYNFQPLQPQLQPTAPPQPQAQTQYHAQAQAQMQAQAQAHARTPQSYLHNPKLELEQEQVPPPKPAADQFSASLGGVATVASSHSAHAAVAPGRTEAENMPMHTGSVANPARAPTATDVGILGSSTGDGLARPIPREIVNGSFQNSGKSLPTADTPDSASVGEIRAAITQIAQSKLEKQQEQERMRVQGQAQVPTQKV